MVELRIVPVVRVVTHHTVRREFSGFVVRIVRILIIVIVTEKAIRRRAAELPVNMTCRAIHQNMRARERKTGLRMIECRGLPCARRVTQFAVLRVAVRRMIFGLLVIIVMTRKTSGRSVCILTINVAL